MNRRTNRPKSMEDIGKKGLLSALEYLKSQRITPEQVSAAAQALDIEEAFFDQQRTDGAQPDYTIETERSMSFEAWVEMAQEGRIDECDLVGEAGAVLDLWEDEEVTE